MAPLPNAGAFIILNLLNAECFCLSLFIEAEITDSIFSFKWQKYHLVMFKLDVLQM